MHLLQQFSMSHLLSNIKQTDNFNRHKCLLLTLLQK